MTATANEVTRVIGALLPDPRFPGSVRVMARGLLLLTVPREVAEAERLQPGQTIPGAQYARLCRAADEEAAYRSAVRRLEMRSFAALDLARRLVLKGHSPEAAQAALARARGAGLIDDERFARHFIETRAARGRGPLRLRRELAGMGVDPAIIDPILADHFGTDDAEAALVARLVDRRRDQLAGLARPVLRRRLLGFLARRGFVGRLAREAVARAISGGSPNPG